MLRKFVLLFVAENETSTKFDIVCEYTASLNGQFYTGRENSIAIEWHHDWTVHNLTAEMCGGLQDGLDHFIDFLLSSDILDRKYLEHNIANKKLIFPFTCLFIVNKIHS